MNTPCPYCGTTLRVRHWDPGQWFLCPHCRRAFRLGMGQAARQLLVALDVSTSAEPWFSQMLAVLNQLVYRTQRESFSDVGIWLFHRRIMPFPCEQLGGLQPLESAVMPTLQDLRSRVGRGTAILDVCHRLLDEAERSPAAARQILILTDGDDRCSRRHPEELRYKLERAAPNTSVCLHIFADAVAQGLRLRLIRSLSIPGVVWSVHPGESHMSARGETHRPLSVAHARIARVNRS